MKMYLVSNGRYEGLEILGIYSTIKKAKFAKDLYAANNEILPMEVDYLPKHFKDKYYYEVLMCKNGEIKKTNKISAQEYKDNPKWIPYFDIDPNDEVSFYVWAKNEDQAKKIADKQRLKLLKKGLWTTNGDEWINLSYKFPGLIFRKNQILPKKNWN